MGVYIAHVVDGPGDPKVVVTAGTDGAGAAAPIVSYPLPPGSDPNKVLTEAGWWVLGVAATEPYHCYEVAPSDWTDLDWVGLVRAVTRARAAALAELERQDAAWRRVIGDAMRVGGVPRQALADAAGVTVARLYQLRDGRR